MGVQTYASLDGLPPAVTAFLEAAAQRSFFLGLPWFQTVMRTASLADDTPRIHVAEQGGRPVAMLMARERRAVGRLKARMLLSASQGMYATVNSPAWDGEVGLAAVREIATAIGRSAPAFDVLRLDSLPARSAEAGALAAGFRDAGMLVQPFFNFLNWFEPVRGLSLAQYLERRSPGLREFLDHDLEILLPQSRRRFELVTGGPDLAAALIDYALVDLQSWKEPEPYPNCTPELARAAATAGCLRLGLLYVDEVPAAAQIWIVSGGRASLWRFHEAERFAELPVEPALNLGVIKHLLEVDQVEEIDFGRDSGAAEGDWLSQRRERIGLLVFNRRSAKGVLSAARQLGGRIAGAVLRRARAVGGH